MSRDVTELLRDTAASPTREVDASAVVARADRRTTARRAAAGAVSLAAIGAVVIGSFAFPSQAPGGEVAPIADRPPGEEEAVDIPDGWVTLTSGDLAVSVPPDWDVDVAFDGLDVPPGATLGGPCRYDLYGGVEGLAEEERLRPPQALVYEVPTSGGCRLIAVTGRAPLGLVLHRSRAGAIADGPTVRFGSVDFVELVDPRAGTTGIGEYVARDLEGGLWISDVDAPVVADILATVRPVGRTADGDGGAPTPLAWEHLGSIYVERPVAEVVHGQVVLGAVWPPIRGLEDIPSVPVGHGAIVVAPGNVGDGGCARLWDVDAVERAGDTAVVTHTPAAREPCLSAYRLQVVAVPLDQLDGVERVEQRYRD